MYWVADKGKVRKNGAISRRNHPIFDYWSVERCQCVDARRYIKAVLRAYRRGYRHRVKLRRWHVVPKDRRACWIEQRPKCVLAQRRCHTDAATFSLPAVARVVGGAPSRGACRRTPFPRFAHTPFAHIEEDVATRSFERVAHRLVALLSRNGIAGCTAIVIFQEVAPHLAYCFASIFFLYLFTRLGAVEVEGTVVFFLGSSGASVFFRLRRTMLPISMFSESR